MLRAKLAELYPKIRFPLWGELSTLMALLTNLAWIAAWYVLLLRLSSWASAYAVLSSVVVLSYVLARLVNALAWSNWQRRLVFALWLVVCGFVSLKLLLFANLPISLIDLLARPVRNFLDPRSDMRETLHLLLLLLAIQRSIRLARGPISLYDTQRSFQLGLLMFLAYGFAIYVVPPRDPRAGMYYDRPETFLALYLFLFCALMAMVTARLDGLGRLRGGRSPLLNRGWLFTTLGAVLVIVGIAVFSGWALEGRFGLILTAAYLALVGLLSVLVVILLTPLLQILAHWIPFLTGWIYTLFSRLRSTVNLLTHLTVAPNSPLPMEAAPPSAQALLTTKLVLFGGGIALTLLVILIGLRWKNILQFFTAETGQVTPLALNPVQLFKRLRRQGLRLQSPQRYLAAARIRRVYSGLMDLCARLGTPRRPALTPLEFLPITESLFPKCQPDLALITRAYLKVRYGELPETSEEVDAVITAWRRIQADSKERLKRKRP